MKTLFLVQAILLRCFDQSALAETSDQWTQRERILQDAEEDSTSSSWLGGTLNLFQGVWHTATSLLDLGDCLGGDDDEVVVPTSPPSPRTPIPTVAPVPAPTRPTRPPTAPTRPPTSPTVPSSFHIQLGLDGVSNDFEFQNAVTKWGQAIVGDVPDYAGNLPGESYCGSWPTQVDDLFICGQYTAIDGPSGVLGAAGPRHYRPSSGIPITGQMKFDSADVVRPGFNLLGVILHEMGHVLGIGPMWKTHGLTDSYQPPCPYKKGTQASREFMSLSGCSDTAIPIEQSFSGTGSNCGHWQESCLGREIMTPAADSTLPISRITIAGLQDLGYQVNYDVADSSYGESHLSSNCRCNERALRHQDTGSNSTATLLQSASLDETPRRLSEEGQRIAIEFGKALLEENRANNNLIPGDGDVPDLGGEVIYVLYEEADGSIHSVMVTLES